MHPFKLYYFSDKACKLINRRTGSEKDFVIEAPNGAGIYEVDINELYESKYIDGNGILRNGYNEYEVILTFGYKNHNMDLNKLMDADEILIPWSFDLKDEREDLFILDNEEMIHNFFADLPLTSSNREIPKGDLNIVFRSVNPVKKNDIVKYKIYREPIPAPSQLFISILPDGIDVFARISWESVFGADGYNLYLKSNGEFVKINTELIPDTEGTISYDTSSLAEGNYEVYATSSKEGDEGPAGDIVTFDITWVLEGGKWNDAGIWLDARQWQDNPGEEHVFTDEVYTYDDSEAEDRIVLYDINGDEISSIELPTMDVRYYYGFNPNEGLHYIRGREDTGLFQFRLYAFDNDGVKQFETENPLWTSTGLEPYPDISKDGLIAFTFSNDANPNNVKIFDHELELLHQHSLTNPDDSTGASPRKILWDNEGNIHIIGSQVYEVLDSSYNSILKLSRSDVWGSSINYSDMAVGDDYIYLLTDRISGTDEIRIARVDRSNFNYSHIGTTSGGHGTGSPKAGIVDKDGNLYFNTRKSPNTVLIRSTPAGVITEENLASEFQVGAGGSYTPIGDKMVISRNFETRIVDLDTMAQDSVIPSSRGAVFSGGQYHAHS